MTASPVEVVCALIVSGKSPDISVLAARRSSGELAGKWEFPGGKIEPGELPGEALVREIREELNCEISLMEALPHFDHDYGRGKLIRLMPFLCQTNDLPIPSEHSEIRNVSRHDCESLDWAEADLPIVRYWRDNSPLPLT